MYVIETLKAIPYD